VLNELLDDCHDIIDLIIDTLPEQSGISKRSMNTAQLGKSMAGNIDISLQPIAHQLEKILFELRQLSNLKDAEMLRKYQLKLDKLENDHKINNLVWKGTKSSNEILPGQAALNELLDQGHDLIDKLIDKLPDSSNLSKREKGQANKNSMDMNADKERTYNVNRSSHQQV
jgi:hypothetical protein